MADFKLSIKGQEKLIRILQTGHTRFLKDVAKRWQLDGQRTIALIVRKMLTGRPGLRRVTGNAARALGTVTKIVGRDVVQKFFLVSSNPAKTYLPIHDKSRKGDGVIRARTKPYLVFKTREGNWVSKKQVRIPIRTDILGAIDKVGGKLRLESTVQALKVFK